MSEPKKPRIQLKFKNSVIDGAGMDNIHIGQPDSVDMELENTSVSGAGRHNVHLAEPPQPKGNKKAANQSKSWGQTTIGQIVVGVIIVIIGYGLLAGLSLLF